VCTLSWLARSHGYLLLFNRDERRTRAPARAPEPFTRAGVTFVAPIDGEFGGTWIGANQLGLTLALLNRYEDSPVEPGAGTVSRGLLVLSLLDAQDQADVANRLRHGRLGDYQPFTLAAVESDTEALLFDWTGATLAETRTGVPGMLRTSSGADQRKAEQSRRAVLEAAVQAAGKLDAEVLEAFHRSHLPERGALSVCMHRPEAETASLSRIEVDPSEIRFDYVPGPPGEGAPPVTLRLARGG